MLDDPNRTFAIKKMKLNRLPPTSGYENVELGAFNMDLEDCTEKTILSSKSSSVASTPRMAPEGKTEKLHIGIHGMEWMEWKKRRKADRVYHAVPPYPL
ncbi:unnamed protein product [Haemonchus placei]|uniref:Protein kinase domain-containing protein n=1 Tax=Haemonchus placei TaxID=6290 RepID=A0A0N4VV46_HAEPC|nr:unnamed protein product [Haemonchus placei]